MAKPLRSANSGPAPSIQFAHFGVLDTGAQSKASTLTAITLNVLIAFVLIVIGAATKVAVDNKKHIVDLTLPIEPKVEPIKPKIIPKPPTPVKLPDVPKIIEMQRKIVIVEPKPDVPKPEIVHMDTPKPVMPEARPLKVVPPPAPVVVNLNAPAVAASVKNHDAAPAPVRLGAPDSPLAPSNRAAVAAVTLPVLGQHGMPPANSGSGNPTPVNIAGNGVPDGSKMRGSASPVPIPGFNTGARGGTGTAAHGPTSVALAQATTPPPPPARTVQSTQQHGTPRLISKPKPAYTADALQQHVEGTVVLKIRVLPNGSVEVLGVSSGLGHGLDESAIQVARGMKFQPAQDASGNPIPWEGVVNVSFQIAG